MRPLSRKLYALKSFTKGLSHHIEVTYTAAFLISPLVDTTVHWHLDLNPLTLDYISIADMASTFHLCSGVISLSVLDLVEKLGMGMYSLRKAKRKMLMRTLYHVNFKVHLSQSSAAGDGEEGEQLHAPKKGRKTCLVRLIPNAAGSAALLVYGKPLIQLHPMNMNQVRHGDFFAQFSASEGQQWKLRFRDLYRMLVFLFLLDAICYDAIMSPYLDFDGGDTDGEMSDEEDCNNDEIDLNDMHDVCSIEATLLNE